MAGRMRKRVCSLILFRCSFCIIRPGFSNPSVITRPESSQDIQPGEWNRIESSSGIKYLLIFSNNLPHRDHLWYSD